MEYVFLVSVELVMKKVYFVVVMKISMEKLIEVV